MEAALSAAEAAALRSVYPRPRAPVPSYPVTAPPRAIPRTGSVVGLWDGATGGPSRDGQAVRHALSAMGIPSEVVTDAAELRRFAVAVVTAAPEGAGDAGRLAGALAGVTAAGTRVLAVAPTAPRLLAGLGVALTTASLATGGLGGTSAELPALRVTDSDDPVARDLRQQGLSQVVLSGGDSADAPARVGYSDRAVYVLGRFEDGRAALVRRDGVYVLGLRTRYHLDLLLAQKHGLAGAAANQPYFEGDLLPLLLRSLYRAHAPAPQVRATAPGGRRGALILTHDADSPQSYQVMQQFLEVERRHGVKATYLVPTSPFSNGTTGMVYHGAMVDALRAAVLEGHEVGSHSFGHLPDFSSLPPRTLGEDAATYMPAYRRGATEGGSHFGELNVSRWLLRTDLGVPAQTFRPGYLAFYRDYYADLEVAGYTHSSARLTADTRTNFPYRAVWTRAGQTQTSAVVEYPLAISDAGLRADNVDQKVASWLQVLDRNLLSGAPTVLLVHPTTRPGKVAALSQLLSQVATRDVWVGDLSTYAAFYEGQGF